MKRGIGISHGFYIESGFNFSACCLPLCYVPIQYSKYRRCSNYIFILDLTPGSNGLGKDKCKTRRESFKLLGGCWCVFYQKMFGSTQIMTSAVHLFSSLATYAWMQYHGWYSSFRIPNVNNAYDHVTFAEKCPILWLVLYLLAPNHNNHDGMGVLHQCVSKCLNETQQNANKCHL